MAAICSVLFYILPVVVSVVNVVGLAIGGEPEKVLKMKRFIQAMEKGD